MTGVAEQKEGVTITEEPPVDMKSALYRFDNDMEFLKRMFVNFLELIPERIGTLAEAVIAGDADKVQSAAHGIKGSASTLSATGVTSLAKNLEDMGRRHDLAGAKHLIEGLRTEISRLAQFVEEL